MTLTPATIRSDLKCGKGAISPGEKCHKGPTSKAAQKRKQLTAVAHVLGVAAVAGGVIGLANMRRRPTNLQVNFPEDSRIRAIGQRRAEVSAANRSNPSPISQRAFNTQPVLTPAPRKPGKPPAPKPGSPEAKTLAAWTASPPPPVEPPLPPSPIVSAAWTKLKRPPISDVWADGFAYQPEAS